ncbi:MULTISPECIES: hypothetical protein [unclassified Brevibacterium]|uniref:hypothetical protein n=1 Tax=unclassified Brevibacterium TaxID=2614124 RepID=UPI001092D934|nr:hypothetical protein [Brevibacterium sp. S22]TGD33315.1 hypothetical protein EB835_02215 [Brevibacterium sp. S22]
MAFIVLVGIAIATGTIAGFERDANVYGGPGEVFFPIAGIAELIAAVVGIVLAAKIRSTRR